MALWNSLPGNTTTSNRRTAGWRLLHCALITLSLAALAGPGLAAEVNPELKQRLATAIANTEGFDDKFVATVWFTDMALRMDRRVPDPDERMQILKHVHQEALKAELDPELVLAVIDIESAFDRWAISVAGARGLMQVMPFWLDELNVPNDNLFDIETNISMGCTILRYYLDMEDGNLTPALARYNGSTGKTWYSEKVLDRLSSRWFRQ